MPAKSGPPAFLYSEIVRVVDDDDFSGEEGWVCGARPTPDQDGWVIEVMVETTDLTRASASSGDWSVSWESVWFLEHALESTGFEQDWDGQDPVRATFDREATPPSRAWRDELDIDLATDVWTDKEADRIARKAQAALRKLVDADDEISWTTCDETEADEPFSVSVWCYPSDLLTAYERVVAEPPRKWTHGKNDEGFLESRWVPANGEGAVFLVPGVASAEVACYRYSSPKQPRPRHSHPRPEGR